MLFRIEADAADPLNDEYDAESSVNDPVNERLAVIPPASVCP